MPFEQYKISASNGREVSSLGNAEIKATYTKSASHWWTALSFDERHAIINVVNRTKGTGYQGDLAAYPYRSQPGHPQMEENFRSILKVLWKEARA